MTVEELRQLLDRCERLAAETSCVRCAQPLRCYGVAVSLQLGVVLCPRCGDVYVAEGVRVIWPCTKRLRELMRSAYGPAIALMQRAIRLKVDPRLEETAARFELAEADL